MEMAGQDTRQLGVIQQHWRGLAQQEGLPIPDLQVGSTILDNPNFFHQSTATVGQTDY